MYVVANNDLLVIGEDPTTAKWPKSSVFIVWPHKLMNNSLKGCALHCFVHELSLDLFYDYFYHPIAIDDGYYWFGVKYGDASVSFFFNGTLLEVNLPHST